MFSGRQNIILVLAGVVLSLCVVTGGMFNLVWVETGPKPISVDDLPRLHTLIANGRDISAIKSLIKQNPEVLQERDFRGRLPLHVAASSGRYEVVRLLIKRGSEVDAPVSKAGFQQHGMRPAHFAALKGHLRILRLLRENGANLRAETEHGLTPVDYVPDEKYQKVVDYLRSVTRDE
jgi:ankyrin repeat protein